MIKDIQITSIPDSQKRVLGHISSNRKTNGKFSVIDLGGSIGGWTYSHVNAIGDINVPKSDDRVKFFQLNANLGDDWEELIEYVNKNGKFDFSICSHMLEDISNPQYVCKQLSKISKTGYIAVPSKYMELSKGDMGMKGCIHHRWIFNFIDNKFTGFPKIPLIEIDKSFDSIGLHQPEYANLGFFWDNEIELYIINNDYLGPSVENVIWMYRKKLFNDDLDKQIKKI